LHNLLPSAVDIKNGLIDVVSLPELSQCYGVLHVRRSYHLPKRPTQVIPLVDGNDTLIHGLQKRGCVGWQVYNDDIRIKIIEVLRVVRSIIQNENFKRNSFILTVLFGSWDKVVEEPIFKNF